MVIRDACQGLMSVTLSKVPAAQSWGPWECQSVCAIESVELSTFTGHPDA